MNLSGLPLALRAKSNISKFQSSTFYKINHLDDQYIYMWLADLQLGEDIIREYEDVFGGHTAVNLLQKLARPDGVSHRSEARCLHRLSCWLHSDIIRGDIIDIMDGSGSWDSDLLFSSEGWCEPLLDIRGHILQLLQVVLLSEALLALMSLLPQHDLITPDSSPDTSHPHTDIGTYSFFRTNKWVRASCTYSRFPRRVLGSSPSSFRLEIIRFTLNVRWKFDVKILMKYWILFQGFFSALRSIRWDDHADRDWLVAGGSD